MVGPGLYLEIIPGLRQLSWWGSAPGSALGFELVTSNLWPQVGVLTCPINSPVAHSTSDLMCLRLARPGCWVPPLMSLLQVLRVPSLQHSPGQRREGGHCFLPKQGSPCLVKAEPTCWHSRCSPPHLGGLLALRLFLIAPCSSVCLQVFWVAS